MNTNTPLIELLELWVKYTDQLWGNTWVSKEVIMELKRINDALDKHGVPAIEVMNTDDTSYTLRYIQRGNKVEKRIQKSA